VTARRDREIMAASSGVLLCLTTSGFATYDGSDSWTFEEFHMRAIAILLFALATAAPEPAFAQMKLPSKAAPGGSEVRYFTAIECRLVQSPRFTRSCTAHVTSRSVASIFRSRLFGTTRATIL